MAGIQLLLTEVTDDQIKIGGVASPTPDLVKVARCFNASKAPIYVDVDHVESLLDDAIVKAAASAELKDGSLLFKQPVIISKTREKKASSTAFTVDMSSIRNLEKVAHACAEDNMEKLATNQFTEDLIDAIHDSQISSEGVMKLSMPVKLEFRDDAAKNAFLGIGRRKKAKAEKLASAIKTVYRRQLIDLAVERLVK